MLFRAFSSPKRGRPDDAAGPGSSAPPGLRAVAGGVLVAGAMFGILVAPSDAETATTTHLVARRDLAPGETLGPDAVEALPMHLPRGTADTAVRTLDERRPLTTLTPIPRGSLIHVDAVRSGPGATEPGAEVSVSVPVGRALGGDVRGGERIDLLATYGSGADGFTTPLGSGALVVRADADEGTLGVEPKLDLTLRLPESVALLPVVHAAHADALTVARPGSGSSTPSAPFRPEPPAAVPMVPA